MTFAPPQPRCSRRRSADGRTSSRPSRRPPISNLAFPLPVIARCACGGNCPACKAASDAVNSMPVRQSGNPLEPKADEMADKILRMAERRPAPVPIERRRRGGEPELTLDTSMPIPENAEQTAVQTPRFSAPFDPSPASGLEESQQIAPAKEINQICLQSALPAVPTYRVTPTVSPTVDSITLITGSTGATTGYGAIVGNSNLNVPGPFNHVPTGEVTNVHQISFHLDSGDSRGLIATRIVRATFSVGGTQINYPSDLAGDPGGLRGTRTHPDGPPDHEVRRPTTNTIVVADAPGIRSLTASQYPFSLSANFTLTVTAGSTDIARVEYSVRISKTSATNIPNRQNAVTVTSKRDLVRGRNL